MVKVAFVCVHNSCRSQMAEAIAKITAAEKFQAFSAGTSPTDKINPDAVAIIKELYNVDMLDSQYPKMIDTLPPVDIVITMGCNVMCPNIPCKHKEDWGLLDPTGKGKDAFILTVKHIEKNITKLLSTIDELRHSGAFGS